jgi:hypothetical protein
LLGLDKAFIYLRVLSLLWCGKDKTWKSTLSLAYFTLSTTVLLLGQGTLYSSTYNYSKSQSLDYYLSLSCCLYYLLVVAMTISLLYSTGQLLEFTPSTPMSPAHVSSHPSPSSSKYFDSEPPYQPPYWRYLHLCHFGHHFDRLCDLNPDVIHLFGSENNINFIQPTPTSSPFSCNEFLFHVDGLDGPLDLTAITSMLDNNSQFIRFQSAYSTVVGEDPLIFDSGASVTITPHRSDFYSYTTDASNIILQGISSTTICKGQGRIKLNVIDDNGASHTINTHALYVPAARVRLLSVQSYCKELGGDSSFVMTSSSCYFQLPSTSWGGTWWSYYL